MVTFPLNRSDRWLSWVWGAITLAYFLIFPILNYSYDSLTYAGDVVSPELFRHFHPHHLLYSRTNWLLLQLARLFSPGISPLVTMSWFGSLMGALAVTIFYRLVIRLNGKRLLSSLLTLVLPISQSYHIFSSMPETAIAPIFFILLAIYLVLFDKKDDLKSALLLGLVMALAVFYHQTSLLYLPVVAVFWMLKSKFRNKWRNLIIFLAFTLGLVGIAYIVMMRFYLGIEEPSGWWDFITHYAHGTLGGFGVWYDWATALQNMLYAGSSAFMATRNRLWGDLLIIVGSSMVLGLVILGLVNAVGRAFRRHWFGLVLVGQLLAVMSFFAWWLVDCSDYWVLPWTLLLVLVGWSFRYFNSSIAAVWLLFYLPTQFLINWASPLLELTNYEYKKEMDHFVSYLVRKYPPERVVFISEHWELAYRVPIVGMEGDDWSEEKQDFEIFATKIISYLEGDPPRIIISSDHFNREFALTLAKSSLREKLPLVLRALRRAEKLPESEKLHSDEGSFWVWGDETALKLR